MRKATLFGKDVYLTEKQWSILVRRFDLDRAKAKERWEGRKFEIKVGCFCANIPCRRCSLNVVRWGEIFGCIRIINKLCGTSTWAFNVIMDEIWWWEEDDKKARRQIQKVYTALMCMEQVKR